MATIPGYVAKKGLDGGRMPNARIIPYEAEAAQKLGNTIASEGFSWAAELEKRQEQKENFIADNAYRKFEIDLGRQMEERQTTMAPDGVGFHDSFLKDVYRPQRDAFVNSLPPRLQEKFRTILDDDNGADTAKWATKAATVETKAMYAWAKAEIGTTQQQLANVISMNPEQYDETLTAGRDLITNAPIPAAEKQTMLREWENVAQTAHLNRLMQDDPELVLKALGANPNMLSPTSQFELLSKSVQKQETGGNPNQISGAGAVGSHQVTLGTAELIAKRMGDDSFPAGRGVNDKIEYLLRPGISKQYGDYHLKWLMKRYPNDLEATLIAYHSGEGAADKWKAAGRDDSVLGPVGKKYYKEVISRLPGGYNPDGVREGGAVPVGEPSSVRLRWVRDGSDKERDLTAGDAELRKLQPVLVDRVRAGFAAAGMDEVRIRSGHRDPGRNEAVGGAKHSQHLTGSAMDIDVSGVSQADRVRLIQSLSAAGVTGLGIGANTIHADIGGRRAWGYGPDGAPDGGIPKWAQGAITAHLANTATSPGVRTAGRYASLPYGTRDQFIKQADTALTQITNKAARGTALDRVMLQSQMDNQISLIRATGQGDDKFDETRIATVLGEEDYVKWVAKREEAQRTFVALDGMREMSPADLADRISTYEPSPSSQNYAAEQRTYDAVVKEASRIERMRANDPDKAAMEYPEIKSQYTALQSAIAQGDPPPAQVQGFVKAMLQKQKEFGTKHEAAAPIPSDWAFEIGQSLTRVPEMSGKNLPDVRAAIAVQYNALQKYFGEYTDDVILYALSEYKGLSKNNAELITAMMQQVAVGGNPFKPRDRSDMDQVESAANGGILNGIREFFGWGTKDGPQNTAVPSPETVNRIINQLDSNDPAGEAVLVERYGKAAVEAAKAQARQGQ